MDARPEGVYCHRETYPTGVLLISNNILVIERVGGDGSVQVFMCAMTEAGSITAFLVAAGAS